MGWDVTSETLMSGTRTRCVSVARAPTASLVRSKLPSTWHSAARVGGIRFANISRTGCLTAIQNWCVRQRLSEYHAGHRAWSRAVLETLPLSVASNDFVFDNKMLVQPIHRRFRIGEISCPTRYF